MSKNKQLKEEYKQLKIPIGVFQITNTVNGKIYVDSNANLTAIWNRYKMQLNAGNHPNIALQEDWTKLGEGAFTFEVLATVEPKDGQTTDAAKELRLLAEMYVQDLQPFGERGYNSNR